LEYDETHIPAEQNKEAAEFRISCPYVHKGRAPDTQKEKKKRAGKIDGCE
jgi:hypothetical protein